MNAPSLQHRPFTRARRTLHEHLVDVTLPEATVGGHLSLPVQPVGVVVIAHIGDSARLSWRERFLANVLARAGFATLLVELLTASECETALRHDVPRLAERLTGAVRWLRAQGAVAGLPLGLLGVGDAAAAALVVTALGEDDVRAVVCRGGRPDRAGAALLLSHAPSLFLVSASEPREHAAAAALCATPRRQLEVIAAEHGPLAEGEALDRVARASARWFGQWVT